MIRRIYTIKGNGNIILELKNSRLLFLNKSLALKVQKTYCEKLENIRSASIFNIPKVEASQTDFLDKKAAEDIYDIISSNGNYYLLFLESGVRSEITIAPGELKIILNCFKKDQSKDVPWDDGRF